MQVTIIVPVFNEERTLEAILHKLESEPYQYPQQQVIVVDDGSRDRSSEILRRWADRPGWTLITHPENRGKGSAVRSGLAHATGAVTVIQDADLEYDPGDLKDVLTPILEGTCDAVYGSRYLVSKESLPWTQFRIAGTIINVIVRALYGKQLTDVNTCYKAVRTELYQALALESKHFEICAETTAKLLRMSIEIHEVPVRYHPRTWAEGKKIGWYDAWQFLWTLLAWRFRRVPHRS